MLEDQLKLFNLKPIKVKRPDIYDVDLTSVYAKLADYIVEWSSKYDKEDVIEELSERFDHHDLFSNNGYELCRILEDDLYYSPDVELVEYMDCSERLVDGVYRGVIKKWVEDCEIKPKYKIGDIVDVEYKGKKYKGEVVNIYEDQAKYTICIEELGHKKPGSTETGTIGAYKNFEEIEKDFFELKK